ncbi:hypothetical protein HNP84_006759 [Thermocatellispora tengchongensis]|uniref:YCII-related domain-containing protein n=1 Tax=Thermocatellispora tengchongensis TaxID=1073253 RepID=A0A840PIS8_9ACTN|nr:YciI family protein [Thermocatellispora tengchongensis]MBB5137007.1 hypothetical protein [Thermocatellispora tengchongensis]
MRYMLLIGADDTAGPEARARLEAMDGCGGWSQEMTERGVLVGGGALRPETATVRVREGEVLVSDGPFAETKDLVGGFSMIECATMEEAVRIAARHPVAAVGKIEIRPVLEP